MIWRLYFSRRQQRKIADFSFTSVIIYHFRQCVGGKPVSTYWRLGGSSVLDVSIHTFDRGYLPDDCRGSNRCGGGDRDEGDVMRSRRRRAPIGLRFSRFCSTRTVDRLSEYSNERYRAGVLATARSTRRAHDPHSRYRFVSERHAAQSTGMVVAHEKRHAGATNECYQEIR